MTRDIPHKIRAFVVASLRSAATYRLAQLMALLGLAALVVPLFAVGSFLQPTMAEAVRSEGGQFFTFLLLGNAALAFALGALGAPSTAIGGTVGNGTLEAMLGTPTSLGTIVAGVCAWPAAWALVRAAVLLLAGVAVGARFAPAGIPFALVFVMLLGITYFGLGLLEAAMVLGFRAATPLPKVVTLASAILGGVYFPARGVPAWLAPVAEFVPLSHALRGIRRLLAGGATMADVLPDLVMLAVMAVTALSLGTLALSLAAQRARRAGTLASY